MHKYLKNNPNVLLVNENADKNNNYFAILEFIKNKCTTTVEKNEIVEKRFNKNKPSYFEERLRSLN